MNPFDELEDGMDFVDDLVIRVEDALGELEERIDRRHQRRARVEQVRAAKLAKMGVTR